MICIDWVGFTRYVGEKLTKIYLNMILIHCIRKLQTKIFQRYRPKEKTTIINKEKEIPAYTWMEE